MGLFKKKEKPVILCDCCGRNITFGSELDYESADYLNKYINPTQDEFDSRIRMIKKAAELAGNSTNDFGLFKFKFGDKRLCGYCFSKMMWSITGTPTSAVEFLRFEKYKIDSINKMITDMSVDEIKERSDAIDREIAEKEAQEASDKADAEAKAKEEWLKSLK